MAKKKVQTVILADSTEIIRLTLWEQNIEKVQMGTCYHITDLISSSYKSYIQLTTTQDTTFTAIEQIEDVKDDFSSLQNIRSINGKMDFCSLSSQLKCMHCTKPINTTDNQIIAKCSSSGVKQKVSQQQMSNVLKFQLKTKDEKKIKLVIFATALQKFKQTYNLIKKSKDFLLIQDNFEIKTQMDSHIVDSIEI